MLRTRSGANRRGDQPERSIHVLGLCMATASCSSCQGHAGCAITIWRFGKSAATVSRWIGRESSSFMPPAAGHARAEPGRAGVHASPGCRARRRSRRSGTRRGRRGEIPARWDAASARADRARRTARSSSRDRGLALERVDRREPDERVRMGTRTPATKSFVTGGRPVLVSASHANNTPSTSAARNTAAIWSTSWCGSVVRKYASHAGPNSPSASSTYSGVDGWTWTSIAAAPARYAAPRPRACRIDRCGR